METAPNPPPPILQLPQEILEEILSSLDLHSDLFSLAGTCCTLASQIIPRHTDYRILRVRTLNPTIFAHLSRRADLARNIREVHICERHNYTTADRIPKALVDTALDCDPNRNGTYDEGLKVYNVLKAIQHMWDLRVFTWSWNFGATTAKGACGGGGGDQAGGSSGRAGRLRPTSEPRFEEAILGEVVRKPTLRHFGISGAFGSHVSGLPLDKTFTYPVWHLSNLTSLCLLGDAWLKTSNALPLCIMLTRTTNLEYLEIPLEFKNLHSLRFPRLKKLKLHLHSGATASVDNSSARFLEQHPTIEELSWYPIGEPVLAPGSLPNLKHLRTNLQVIRGLAKEAEVASSFSQEVGVPGFGTLSKIDEVPEPEDSDNDSEGGYVWPSPPSPSSSFNSPPASPLEPMAVPPSTPITAMHPYRYTPHYVRPIESLDVSGLSASELLSLSFIDRTSLKKLALHNFTNVETVVQVAEVFPNVEWLMLPVRHSPSAAATSSSSSSSSTSHSQRLSVDTLLSILPHFSSLRILRGRALWSAVGGEKEKTRMHEVLGELVQICPKLKEVDHCDFYEKRWGFKRVVVNRKTTTVRNQSEEEGVDEEEIELVDYNIKKPFMRDCFDVLDGAFN